MDDPVFSLYFTIYYSTDNPRAAEIRKIKTLEDVKTLGLTTVSNRGNGRHEANVESLGIPTTRVIDDANMLRFLAARRADLIIDTPLSMRPKIIGMGLEHRLAARNTGRKSRDSWKGTTENIRGVKGGEAHPGRQHTASPSA